MLTLSVLKQEAINAMELFGLIYPERAIANYAVYVMRRVLSIEELHSYRAYQRFIQSVLNGSQSAHPTEEMT